MLNAWFYAHKTWQIGLVVDSALILVALVGLRVFHRLVAWRHREHDTAMVGLSYALAGGLYAVMLAFVAAATFETMDKSEGIASEEANSLSSLIFDSGGLGSSTASKVRREIDDYIEVVTKKEWPDQKIYRMDPRNFAEGWNILARINTDLATFEPATDGQATVQLEMEHAVNDLFTSRRTRLLAARQHLPAAIWQMLIFGAGLVAIYLYLFGPYSFRIHVAVTAMTMLSIGVVMTLIIAQDYPFRGIVSVDSESYSEVQEVAEHVFHGKATAPHSSEQSNNPSVER